jgi:hypothetical protein
MKVLRSISVLFALLLAVSAAHAQTPALQAAIPFNFVVGNRVLPAGHYTLGSKWLNAPNLISMRDLDENLTTVTGSNSCYVSRAPKATKLVFHRIGNEYFLYQIWIEGETTGREFPKSKLEVQMANNAPQTEEVIVAALLMR